MKQEKSEKATIREFLESEYLSLSKELMSRLFEQYEGEEYYVVKKEFESTEEVENLFKLYFNKVENKVLRSLITKVD